MNTKMSCYKCYRREVCLFQDTMNRYWCEECIKDYNERRSVNEWKPVDYCNCDECSDAKAINKVPIPSECELYPYLSFTKIKTKS